MRALDLAGPPRDELALGRVEAGAESGGGSTEVAAASLAVPVEPPRLWVEWCVRKGGFHAVRSRSDSDRRMLGESTAGARGSWVGPVTVN